MIDLNWEIAHRELNILEQALADALTYSIARADALQEDKERTVPLTQWQGILP